MKPQFDVFRNAPVFITGHTGFKGSWLASWLHLLGADVTGYSLPPKRPEDHFNALRLESRVRHIEGDILDAGHLARAVSEARPEFVFHLAAQPLVRRSYLEPRLTFETNVLGSVNLMEALRGSESTRVLIFVTSDKCYKDQSGNWGYRETDPLGGRDPYSASKACAELVFSCYQASYFATQGLRSGSVRAGNVIGGGDWAEDRIVPDSIRALSSGQNICLRQPRTVRPWQHVLEPLSGYLTLASELAGDKGSALTGEAWNYGPAAGSHRTVEELAQAVVSRWGDGKVVVSEALDTHLKESAMLYLNCDKTQHRTGWRPQWDFERSIETTVDWYRCFLGGADSWRLTTSQIAAYSEVHK